MENLTAKDGISLFTHAWIPPQYHAAICIVHGFGEHGRRYAHVADFFNQQGYAVVAFDNRGHGKSGGKQGHAPSVDSYLDDIEVFLTAAKQQFGNTPLFLYGHSMGGNLALNYVLKRDVSILRGVVATGTWIRLAFEPNPMLLTLGKIMRSIFPTFTQSSGLVQEHISKDPAVVAAYSKDPLVHGRITASAGMGLTESAAFLNSFAGKMPIPTLIMHGEEDQLTSQPASEEFASRVSGDLTYKKWDGMYHEVHNEPDKIQVLKYIFGWLDSRQ
jgi:alpha-beta hydrolase superfamily lysophospholipase